MKVLFVSGGNYVNGISPIIENQANSLIKNNINVSHFTIKGKGLEGYVRAIFKLRRHLKNNSYDIVHAHYSLSGFVASLAGAKNIVVSLMGSDVKSKLWLKWIIYLFHFISWKKTIVKSNDMKNSLGLRNILVIPNGVNMNKFRQIDRQIALKKLNWNIKKKHILFAADPNRYEKNFPLAKEVFEKMDQNIYELHYFKDVPNDEIYYYYNAADIVILTSFWEGSPNVIKEALSCNAKIVSTDVGDVKSIVKDIEGSYVSLFDIDDMLNKINQSLNMSEEYIGREGILYLDDNIISKKIIQLYKDLND